MQTVMLNVPVNPEIKEKAEAVLNQLDLTLDTAIEMFLQATVDQECLPFEILDEETIAAIEEGKRIADDPNVKAYDSVEELRADLGV